MERAANPNAIAYEVVILEPPVAGQYETTVDQTGTWRQEDSWVVERQAAFAEAIAEILGHGSFLGRTIATDEDLQDAVRDVEAGKKLFYVPHLTLSDTDGIERLRIDASNLYGGCVHYPHEGTKVLMRDLLRTDSPRPDGWNVALARTVAPLGIPGYAVFSGDDLADAMRAILDRHGAVRVKLATGADAEGQYVVDDASRVPSTVDTILARYPMGRGACVEVDLIDPLLYSVNTENIGALRISSIGRYRRDMSERGAEAGIGTDDEVALGGLDSLDVSRSLFREHPDIPEVMALATRFDRAVREHLGEMILTRNLYQFAVGHDARGKKHIGTLEQSWRRGGIGACTLLAAKAFLADDTLVQVSCMKENAFTGEIKPTDWILARRDGTPFLSRITHRHHAGPAE